jgi:hypothetical protein
MEYAAPERFLQTLHSRNGAWSIDKKTDVAKHHVKVFRHVGLLVNGPSSVAGVPFI